MEDYVVFGQWFVVICGVPEAANHAAVGQEVAMTLVCGYWV